MLPGGCLRPQNDGLLVADEQEPMNPNEERNRKRTAAAICRLGLLRARRHRGPEQPGEIYNLVYTRINEHTFLAGRYAPSPGETREAGETKQCRSLPALTDLRGMSPG